MDNCWNLFNTNTMNNNNNTSNNARVFWESKLLDSRSNNPRNSFTQDNMAAAQREENGSVQAILFDDVHHSSCLYRGGGGGGGGSHSYCYPDPHLMCLKLGKRHYFGDAAAPLGEAVSEAGFSMTKRGKPYFADGLLVGASISTSTSSSSSAAGVTVSASSPAVVPRCQVDGCHVALVNAKDYHRRHKVCEMHSKSPKVVVLGLEQRFCQQCSRFHAVEEFDESKRSCRRRLAGHNERRRKSSQDQSAPRNHSPVNGKLMTCSGRHPYFSLSSGCALSLLSSKNDSWISSADHPARCSAALCELIAENRAAILARQLILDKDLPWNYHSNVSPNARQNGSNSLVNCQQQLANNGSHSWDHISQAEGHATMDLKQAPNSAFGFLSLRGKSTEDEESPELWGSFGGAHVV